MKEREDADEARLARAGKCAGRDNGARFVVDLQLRLCWDGLS